jgi:hypothetical protein
MESEPVAGTGRAFLLFLNRGDWGLAAAVEAVIAERLYDR